MEYLNFLGYCFAGFGVGFAFIGKGKKATFGWLSMAIGFFILQYTGM